MTYTIIGADFTGLICAKILASKGVGFLGFEKREKIEPSARSYLLRCYEEESIEFLRRNLEGFECQRIEEEVRERSKGEWKALVGEYEEEERYFLRAPYFRPSQGYAQLMRGLIAEVGSRFQVHKSVVRVDPESKELEFQGGVRATYDKLIWCAPLEALTKAWTGEIPPVLRSLTTPEEPAGMLSLDLESDREISLSQNAVVFPFKYKDLKLKAFGINEPWPTGLGKGQYSLHWSVFLNSEIAEDREEIAKCVRALKRELYKEFGDLKEAVRGERITYQPGIAGYAKHAAKSLELLPEVLYVGPQLRLSETPAEITKLDRTLRNCAFLEQLVAHQTR